MGDSSAALALTLPTDGASSTRRILLRFLKKLARDALRVPPGLVGPELEGTAREVQALIRRFGQEDPRALYGVLRKSHVHVLLTCTLRALDDGDGRAAQQRYRAFLFQLLCELALEGSLPEALRWPAPPPVDAVASPVRRLYVPLGGGVQAMRFAAGEIATEGPGGGPIPLDGEPSARFPSVAPGVVLALEDNNPISDFEAHPDKEGNQLDLGDASAERWVSVLGESLATIERWMPNFRGEMALVLQQLVPVGTDDVKHLSASYREAIGTVYLTLHPKLVTMIEAVIHEYQHNKITMLFHLDGVMDNLYEPLFRSPVRPDPRPLHGVLLAAHAFVPVAELYRRMVEADAPEVHQDAFMERFRQVLDKNGDALEILDEHAEATPAGAQVIAELGALHREHRALGV